MAVETTAEVRAARPGAWRWAVLGLSAQLFACSQFYRVSSAVVAPQLQAELGLSAEALGGLSAAFFYAFAAAQIPLALCLDRLGARRTMTILSLVGAAGAVVFATSSGLAGVTLGRVLLGVGMAGNLMGSMNLIGQWFSAREFATLSGVLAAFGTVGNILATTPLALLVQAMGWRRAFTVVGLATAVLTAVFWVLVRDRPDDGGAPERGGEERLSVASMVGRLLASRDYWLISLGTFCRYGSFVAIQGLWAVPYLTEVVGLSAVESANLVLLLNVAFVAGSPLGGWLSDRVLSSRKKLALLALAGMAGTVLVLAVTAGRAGVWTVAVVFVVLGVTSSFGQVVYAHMKELMPSRMAGMAMTGVNFFTMLGAAAFLHGMGWVLDRWSAPAGHRGPDAYRAAFMIVSLVVAVAFALYLLTRDSDLGGGRAGAAQAVRDRAARERS